MADKLLKMFSLNVTNNSSFISNLCDFLNCEKKNQTSQIWTKTLFSLYSLKDK